MHTSTQKLDQVQLKAAEIHQASPWFEFDEEVYVAVRCCLAAGNGAENADTARPPDSRDPEDVPPSRSQFVQERRGCAVDVRIWRHVTGHHTSGRCRSLTPATLNPFP